MRPNIGASEQMITLEYGKEVLAKYREQNPDKKLALAVSKRNGEVSGIGVWDHDAGRYVCVVATTIMDTWVHMPYEIRANGELPAFDWAE